MEATKQVSNFQTIESFFTDFSMSFINPLQYIKPLHPNPTYYRIFLLYMLDKPSEWNIVECIVSFLSSILLLLTFPISLFFCIKVSLLLFWLSSYCKFTSKKHRLIMLNRTEKRGDGLSKVMSLYGNPTLQPFGCKNRFKCAWPSAKGSR